MNIGRKIKDFRLVKGVTQETLEMGLDPRSSNKEPRPYRLGSLFGCIAPKSLYRGRKKQTVLCAKQS